jgi:hypothetical protein
MAEHPRSAEENPSQNDHQVSAKRRFPSQFGQPTSICRRTGSQPLLRADSAIGTLRCDISGG